MLNGFIACISNDAAFPNYLTESASRISRRGAAFGVAEFSGGGEDGGNGFDPSRLRVNSAGAAADDAGEH